MIQTPYLRKIIIQTLNSLNIQICLPLYKNNMCSNKGFKGFMVLTHDYSNGKLKPKKNQCQTKA